MPGFPTIDSMQHVQKLMNMSKAGLLNFHNQTAVMEQLKTLHMTMGNEKHENTWVMRNYKILAGFGCAMAVLACCMMAFLLRDEYRQAQLRKRGYNKVQMNSLG